MSDRLEEFMNKFYDVKIIPCLLVNEIIMNNIENEVTQIIKDGQMSFVGEKEHVTNWTKPYGAAIQFSLYNTSKSTSDFSTDHNLLQTDNSGERKKSFVNPNLKNLHAFFSLFENHVMNFRLNGMGKNSGLSPHREYNIHDSRYRIRLHLPVITNDSAWMMVDGEKFHFKRGVVYFFNNGLTHAAGNDGNEVRYHLVWDNWLDETFFTKVLDLTNDNTFDKNIVTKLPPQMSTLLSKSEPYHYTEYEDQVKGTIKVD